MKLFFVNPHRELLCEDPRMSSGFCMDISLVSAKVLRRDTVANYNDRGQELLIPICVGVRVTRHTCLEDASVEFSLSGFLTAPEFFKFERCGHLTVSDRYHRIICTAAWIDQNGQATKEKARFFFGGKGCVFLTANEVVAVSQSLLKIEEIYRSNFDLGMYPEVNKDLDLENAVKEATKPAAPVKATAASTTPTTP